MKNVCDVLLSVASRWTVEEKEEKKIIQKILRYKYKLAELLVSKFFFLSFFTVFFCRVVLILLHFCRVEIYLICIAFCFVQRCKGIAMAISKYNRFITAPPFIDLEFLKSGMLDYVTGKERKSQCGEGKGKVAKVMNSIHLAYVFSASFVVRPH